MAKFRKKPVEVEAFQWSPSCYVPGAPPWFRVAINAGKVAPAGEYGSPAGLKIETLEGTLIAQPGDWIIKGVAGEIYPCKPDIFEATYEEASQK